jgi:hypothetical protein
MAAVAAGVCGTWDGGCSNGVGEATQERETLKTIFGEVLDVPNYSLQFAKPCSFQYPLQAFNSYTSFLWGRI